VRLEISLFSCFWNCDLIWFGCILLSALFIQMFNISDLNVSEKFITNIGFGRLFLSPIISILFVSLVEQPFTLDIFG
jgi:hypothetical protein